MTVGVAVEFVAIASCPLDTPVAVGANCTFNVAVCPEFSVAGSVIVDVENEAPEAVMENRRRASEALKDLTQEMRDHDRRLTRLEAQWDTAALLSRKRLE